MRLIDADALHKYVEDKFKDNVPYEWAWVLTAVDSAPTVDAVPVVRCKDCKYKMGRLCKNPMAVGWDALEPEDDDFCSRGERKDDANDEQ